MRARQSGSKGRWLEMKALAFVSIGALALSGCDALDRLVGVEAPSRVVGDEIDIPSNASLLVNSAITDFECALAEYINIGGALGFEYADVSVNWFNWPVDQRTFAKSGLLGSNWGFATCDQNLRLGLTIPQSTARWLADHALELLQGWTDEEVPGNRDLLIATAAAYAGYSYVLIGESWCEATFDAGPAMQPAEVFGLAKQRFGTAIQAAQAANAEDILNLARVGMARANGRLGQWDEAATAAAAVPDGFSYTAYYSSASLRSENKVWTLNHRYRAYSVDEPYRSMMFNGVPDPRVPVEDTGVTGDDNQNPLWHQLKYMDAADPIPFATAEEARLIQAEAALNEGNLKAAVDFINGLHAQVGLPPFESSSADEIRDQLMYERRAQFFLDGHHLGDIRQYDWPLWPAPGTPYFEKAGGMFGDQRCFPIHEQEYQNNPNVSG